MLRLSVVIPSHCATDLLRSCLFSISQFAPPETEVIVVDDGSVDAAVSTTALEFPNVRVIRLPRSRGFCVAANRGIESARGDIIELLNDDTQVTAGWADAAIDCFKDERLGAVAPLVLQDSPWRADARKNTGASQQNNPCPSGQRLAKQIRIDSAGDGYDPGGFAWKIGHRQFLDDRFLKGGLVEGASGSSVFLRRAALERTGLFPEHFGAYFEDVDLSQRLTAAGFVIRYEPASRIWHRGGSSHGRRNRRLMEQQSCNEERVFWRNLKTERRWHDLTRHLAVLAGKTLRRIREGTLLPFAFGRLRALSELGSSSSKKDDPSCPKLLPLGPN